MTTSPASTDLDAAVAVRARLAQVHSALMGGRGPGADEPEIARHTRERATIAGHSVTARLAATQRQTDAERGDLSALVEVIGMSSAALASGIGTLIENYAPTRIIGRVRDRGQNAAAAQVERAASKLAHSPRARFWLAAVLAAGAALLIASRYRRSGRGVR